MIPVWALIDYGVIGLFITAYFDRQHTDEFDDFGRFLCVVLWPIPLVLYLTYHLTYHLVLKTAALVKFLANIGKKIKEERLPK